MTKIGKISAAEVASASLVDLLGTPIAFSKAPKAPKGPRILLTEEEKKAKRNEAQKALRATPEGRTYANAASKKSIALKKAKIAAELEALKALVATLAPQDEIVAEETPKAEETVVEPSKKVSKAKKASKKETTTEEAPL